MTHQEMDKLMIEYEPTINNLSTNNFIKLCSYIKSGATSKQAVDWLKVAEPIAKIETEIQDNFWRGIGGSLN